MNWVWIGLGLAALYGLSRSGQSEGSGYASDGTTDSTTSPGSGTFAERWQKDAPPPYNQQYSTFFRKTDGLVTEDIYRSMVGTIRLLVQGMQGQPYHIKCVQNAYRDPDFNKSIGGDANSLHMRGQAIDFLLTEDLQNISEAEMESMGRALNKVGLKVIWYPFRTSDRSVHVQVSEAARKGARRVDYRGRGERGYHASYEAAKNA